MKLTGGKQPVISSSDVVSAVWLCFDLITSRLIIIVSWGETEGCGNGLDSKMAPG